MSLLLVLGACQTSAKDLWREEDYPGELRTVESLPIEGVWRQRVTASWGDSEERGFDAALQRTGDALTVLGLSPMGSVGFAFELRNTGIEVINHSGQALPIPARFILLDVQRSFYPWLPASSAFGIDGRYEGEVDGEHIVETLEGGRVRERVFRRIDGEPEGVIRVSYRWSREDWSVPDLVELENGWFGYRLRVETLEETLLPEPGS